MRTTAGLFAVLLLSCLASVAAAPRAGGGQTSPGAARPMSVLIIMADQHNPRALGCYGNGYGGLTTSLTPSLDRLAEQGTRFENAFCSQPQCNPSRVSVITGQYPHNHGVRWNGVWEPRNLVTMARLAREAGYATATIGKHHFSWADQLPPLEEDLGFDLVVDMPAYAQFCGQHGQPQFTAPGAYVDEVNIPGALAPTGYTTNPNRFHPMGFWADKTIEFLEARAGDERPFVCFYSMYGPHTPILPSAAPGETDWAHRYYPFQTLTLPPNVHRLATTARLAGLQNQFSQVNDLVWQEVLALYYGFIAQMDFNIGRVLARLDELGLAEDTLVLFTADHGDMSAEMTTWTKGGGNYDAVARVPLIVRLPSRFKADSVRRELISNVDILPTVLECTGIPISDANRARLDGRSFLDALLVDRNPQNWRQDVLIEFGHPDVSTSLRVRTLRSLTEKLSLDDLAGGDLEYYEIDTDPYEEHDLAQSALPAVQQAVDDMSARLAVQWGDETQHAPIYALTGGSRSKPAAPKAVQPAPGASGVSRVVQPSFVPATSASRQEVFFGTDPGNLTLHRVLGAMAASFHPGSLAPSTTYYWRVDGVNPHGRRTGPVWSFTTEADSRFLPSLASVIAPAADAADVPLITLLRWVPAAGAVTQEVWFAEAGQELRRVRTGLAATVGQVALPRFLGDREYVWRVDAIGPEGKVEGEHWQFRTTAAGVPERASNPVPAHLDENAGMMLLGAPLRWNSGPGTTLHAVHLGTSFPLPEVASTTLSFHWPSGLQPGTTYYWRVDTINAFGRTSGSTWRFTVPQ